MTLTAAKATQSSLKQEAEQFIGETQREFRRKTDEIGASKSSYFSKVFVGNHVDIIFKEFEYLIEGLDTSPNLQSGIMEVVECYRTIHFMMQHRRFLTPAELASLRYECTKLGEIFPRVFQCSLPPKLDALVFIVPMFAEEWGTIGGLREEGMERLHNMLNQVNVRERVRSAFAFQVLRILACVRKKDDRLLMALQRNEMRDPELAKPKARNFKKSV